MKDFDDVLELIRNAFTDATGISVHNEQEAIIDDSVVAHAIRKTMESQGVTLWPKDRETVYEYAVRVAISLGFEPPEEAPLDFSS